MSEDVNKPAGSLISTTSGQGSELVWHAPGQAVSICGMDIISGGFYCHDLPSPSTYPFAVNQLLPVAWALPSLPLGDPDYRTMSPEHRAFFLVWLHYRDLATMPQNSVTSLVQTWLRGMEWRLLTQGEYDPLIIDELLDEFLGGSFDHFIAADWTC